MLPSHTFAVAICLSLISVARSLQFTAAVPAFAILGRCPLRSYRAPSQRIVEPTSTYGVLRADLTFSRRRRSFVSALSSDATVGDEGTDPPPKKKKTKKKKKKFAVRADLTEADVSSDGLLEGRPRREVAGAGAGQPSNLGVPSKRRMKDRNGPGGGGGGGRRTSAKAAKIQRQRTAGGTVDSSSATVFAGPPEEQKIQVQAAKRGNKAVTIVRGLTSPMEDRKKLLKEMKSKLGGGGTLVDGILELQGSHAEKVLVLLKSRGFSKAKIVGK